MNETSRTKRTAQLNVSMMDDLVSDSSAAGASSNVAEDRELSAEDQYAQAYHGRFKILMNSRRLLRLMGFSDLEYLRGFTVSSSSEPKLMICLYWHLEPR